ncbi:hypothetical protein OIT41_08525 [Arthrobacter sp. YA7-1]|uniref:hypothetical protein n=1 Tax=Arthrobacter sp. YA7-1 TaxID=2987701 RepID=UPI0022278308|nr:hypothetical protein [Arthrobacter sp. YA7-1]UYY83061.1 hypothetical protein OIT41_08525 [Arthrobacter sp. YA7-1]
MTNIPAKRHDLMIGSNHDLWHVEQSFRMSKPDPRARPMFHRTALPGLPHLVPPSR